MDKLAGQIANSLVSVRVLRRARLGPFCGAEVADELARAGCRVSPSVLYALLHALHRDGDIAPAGARSSRQYYRITARGTRTLAKAQRDMRHITSALAYESERSTAIPPTSTRKPGSRISRTSTRLVAG